MKLSPPFDWMLKRSRPSREVTLDLRRIYILPTREGMIFAAILLLMLLASLNYALSLGFALTFLLAAIGLVSILHTCKNLSGLKFIPGKIRPAFAGKTANFPVRVDNGSDYGRYGIMLDTATPRFYDVEQQGSTEMLIETPAMQRGRLHPPRFTVSSTYPLGLFRAWSYIELDMNCIVYPRPEKPVRSPEVASSDQGKSQSSGRDDFAGLRNYRLGDSMHHIAWKALARGKGLFTKEFSAQEGGKRVWLDWNSFHGIETESRLSQLTQMALDAQQSNQPWGLRLPGSTIEVGQGEAHLAHCLETLALWGLE